MRLSNSFGAVSVQPLGAMLHDSTFQLDGREVRPLYDAPWRGDRGEDFDSLPPIIQKLGSEWPCVPFGRPPDNLDLPPEWEACDTKPWDSWAHGYASNKDWALERLSESALRATIEYPDTTPILRLERDVRLLEGRPGLALSLTVHARRETHFPLGLHPVLSMEGAAPESLRLDVSKQARAWSFPVDVEPGRNHYKPDQHNRPLDQFDTCFSGPTDVRNLPPKGQTEDLLMLTGSEGAVSLHNPAQNCVTTVKWEASKLPGCLLWVSNGGRDYYPWNGRVAALGIEPVASAFDLGLPHSLSSNTPLSKHGVQTSVTAGPDAPFVCEYMILVEPR